MAEVDKTKLSPGMLQYFEFKEKNMDVILFFRLGDFYEMFFEDAILASRELELTLTSKNAGLEERVPMCGVPYHAAAVYIEKLVNKGYRVAIAEQVENPKNAKGIVKREIIQVVSKGTIINNESLNEKEYNYIGSIMDLSHAYVLTYTDITTGVIYASMIEHTPSKLVSEIVSLGLKEIIVSNSFDRSITNLLNKEFSLVITYSDDIKDIDEYKYIYEDVDDIRYINGIKYLLTYITDIEKRVLTHFEKVIIKNKDDYLKMDIHTKRNLELTETLRLKERQYSLIWLLDKTKTAMGSRMLKNYIENPLIDIDKINQRYDVVETLLNEFILKSDLDKYLDEVYDLERLSGRIAFGNANGRDLLQLKNSIRVLPEIKKILNSINYKDDIEELNELYELIENAIYEEPPISIKEGYLIKEGYNSELDELKDLRKGGKDFIAKFENEEKERTGIKTLKVGYNRVFGYYIEVSKGQIKDIKDEYGYERRQTLANAERYISPILKEKEALILNAEEKIIELEYNLFCEIRDEVKRYIPRLQRIAKIISEIDVLSSFATVSEDNNYVRPNLTTDRSMHIKDNRHPVVEKVLTVPFVANDIDMDDDTNILLITGPNMAGKSTYMRELAITVIMAQIGCFVPASEATIPIFDAIYTRIGASDDLVSGESTFMVEMSEANHAISNATPNSLILFDELGRGTATYDGMSLAYAIIEYVHELGCKTLFSTHYHELTDLDTKLKHLKNVHVSAYEENGNITFLHKIKEGAIDKSYGIHVAKLANLPDKVIKKAEEVLKIYEGNDNKKSMNIQESLPLDELVHNDYDDVIDKIKEIDVLHITPIEALNVLYDLKNKIE
ncbi:MAG: DNA mismatch repair protein MutS [Bacilli bacterium]|nr:DNA mismatch repair protein MutS [Bacilli bacterium]